MFIQSKKIVNELKRVRNIKKTGTILHPGPIFLPNKQQEMKPIKGNKNIVIKV